MERMDELIELPGERNNTFVFYHEGYCYHVDKRSGTTFQCSKRSISGCPGRVKVLDEDLTVDRASITEHNCGSFDEWFREKSFFRRDLYEECQSSADRLSDVYTRILDRHPHVIGRVSFEELESSMKYYRRKSTPPVPATLLAIATTILGFLPIATYYSGHCTLRNGSTALIFINPDLMDGLRRTRSLFCDETFKIRPSNPRDISQVYTFHITRYNYGFPAIICFTSNKTSDLYEAMLEYILTKVPELRINVNKIHVDYERAIIKAIRNVLPHVRILGCLFHYCQAIVKFWKRQLKITRTEVTDGVLELLLALPFLPPNNIEDGLNYVVSEMNRSNIEGSPRLSRYFSRMWLPIAHIISVYGRITRTNNVSESFHKQAKAKIGIRQGISTMLEKLARLMKHYSNRWTAITNGRFERYKGSAALTSFNTWLSGQEPRYRQMEQATRVREYLTLIATQKLSQRLSAVNIEEEEVLDEVAHNQLIDNLYALGGEIRPDGEARNMALLDYFVVPDDLEPYDAAPGRRGRGLRVRRRQRLRHVQQNVLRDEAEQENNDQVELNEPRGLVAANEQNSEPQPDVVDLQPEVAVNEEIPDLPANAPGEARRLRALNREAIRLVQFPAAPVEPQHQLIPNDDEIINVQSSDEEEMPDDVDERNIFRDQRLSGRDYNPYMNLMSDQANGANQPELANVVENNESDDQRDADQVQPLAQQVPMQAARRRRRMPMEANAELNPQNSSELEKKRAKNKQRKLNWKKKKQLQATQLAELEQSKTRLLEMERHAAEQRNELDRRRIELEEAMEEINRNATYCCICRTNKPTRVWQPCAHACVCESCIIGLLQ